MTAAIAAGAGLITSTVLRERRVRHAAAWGALAGTALVFPLLAAAVVAGVILVSVGSRHGRRRARAAAAADDVVLLADLVALGLGAGLGLPAALDAAAPDLEPALTAELAGVRRQMEQSGAEAGLAGSTGRAERLYRLLGRAAATGAPLIVAVESFAAECRHSRHTRHLEAARRLPVRLLIPLALLILPGFVVLAVGPALLEALSRLSL